MTVASIATDAAQWAGPAARPTTMGQSDFIRLMTEQMKMQDPLEPVDNKEMIAQMAQFSSLSGIENINSTLKAISVQIGEAMAAQAAAAQALAAQIVATVAAPRAAAAQPATTTTTTTA